jgi:CBS domain-containing protein
VLIASPEESVREAAQRMAESQVGSVVVVDPQRRPTGIVTDRDITIRCVAPGRDPDTTPVSAVMTAPLVKVHESTPIEDALGAMVGGGVRRLVVLDAAGGLVGILALDDVLELLAEETEKIGRLLAKRPVRVGPG